MWEDGRNKHGGRWLINSGRNQRPELDRIWLETVFTDRIFKSVSVSNILA